MRRVLGLSTLALLLGLAWDDEASNIAHVRASEGGRCYAKSTPREPYGQAGVTRVFAVRTDADSLLHALDWYSQQFYLRCPVARPAAPSGTSIVRFGPWARGQRASRADLALAFYFDGKLLRRYSTLDLAGRPDNVQRSVSHYVVIDSVGGYRTADAPELVFEVRLVDRRVIRFDPTTGGIVRDSPRD